MRKFHENAFLGSGKQFFFRRSISFRAFEFVVNERHERLIIATRNTQAKAGRADREHFFEGKATIQEIEKEDVGEIDFRTGSPRALILDSNGA
jgi:hypothetical protein